MFFRVLFVIRVTHVTLYVLTYSQRPAFTACETLQKSETGKQHRRKIQLFKAQKTENSVEKSEEKQNNKDVQKKKIIDTQCESNINTVGEELVSSQKI